MKVLLLTGPAGPTQGWGDMATTYRMKTALEKKGRSIQIGYVESRDEFLNMLDEGYDVVWSALYHFDQSAKCVGKGNNVEWVADLLEEREIPYVGSNSISMKRMIDKASTHEFLNKLGIPVPHQSIVSKDNKIPTELVFPLFVKPRFESESAGITEASVVENISALENQVEYIQRKFNQDALIEEYLPGKEMTVPMVGNGKTRKIFPVINIIFPDNYKKYPVIREDIKGHQAIKLTIPDQHRIRAAEELTTKVADLMGCLDHIRIDLREDKNQQLKVIEVNGIPGLNPSKSRSLRIQGLHNSELNPEENFAYLINYILESSLERYSISHPA